MEKMKNYGSLSKVNYVYVDHLDRKMYDLFLKIKSKFNKYAPINKDKKVMIIIGDTIKALLNNFVENNML